MGRIRGNLLCWKGGRNIDLVAECFGDAKAAPIILVHGGGQSRHSWRRGAESTATAGFHAIAIDQRGHGDSGWADDGDYSPGAIAGDIQNLMRALDQPAILVGASRGGYATLVAAARAEPPARALVLVEIAPRIDRSGAEQVRSFMRASVGGFDDVEQAALMLDRYMYRTSRKSPDTLRKSMRQDEDGRWFWRWDPQVATGGAETPELAEAELDAAARGVTCPILLVRGERSELVKDEHVRHLKSLVPHLEVVTIAGAGHMVSGDDNDLFNQAILDFVSSLGTMTQCRDASEPQADIMRSY